MGDKTIPVPCHEPLWYSGCGQKDDCKWTKGIYVKLEGNSSKERKTRLQARWTTDTPHQFKRHETRVKDRAPRDDRRDQDLGSSWRVQITIP